MIHIIYKTTCLVTKKFYIGMHSSKKPDNYLGSGNILRSSVSKYGKANHIREVIATAETREELRKLEEQIVTRGLLEDPQCMNLAVGGCGSGVGRIVTEDTRKLLSSIRKGWEHMDPQVRERAKLELSERQSSKRGDLHFASKLWTLQSPSGEVFTTKDMTSFCQEHNLNYSSLRNRAREKSRVPLTKGVSKGWVVVSCT